MIASQRFMVLDGWRGICALSVALLHFSFSGHLFGLGWVRNAGIFVDFFFVLSGFVVTHAYKKRVNTTLSARKFLLRRIGRLWPLHVATLLALVTLETVKFFLTRCLGAPAGEAAFTAGATPWSIPTNLLLIHSLGLHDIETWNGPSWSISTEMWAYVSFAIMGVLLANRHWRYVCAGIVAVSLAIVWRYAGHFGPTHDFGFFRCLAGFFTGVLAYDIYLSTITFPKKLVIAFEIILTSGLIAYASFYTEIGLGASKGFVFAAVILVFAHEAGPVSWILRARPLAFLGRVSFSIYMCHGLVWRFWAVPPAFLSIWRRLSFGALCSGTAANMTCCLSGHHG